MRGKVAVDFDGVIHTHISPYGNPPIGKPTVGLRSGLQRLQDAGYELIVFTARDANSVLEWLERWELKVYFTRITNIKSPDIVAFFDDRGWHVERNRPNGLLVAVEQFLDARSESENVVSPALRPNPQQRLGA